jgi:hypothetical protein
MTNRRELKHGLEKRYRATKDGERQQILTGFVKGTRAMIALGGCQGRFSRGARPGRSTCGSRPKNHAHLDHRMSRNRDSYRGSKVFG